MKHFIRTLLFIFCTVSSLVAENSKPHFVVGKTELIPKLSFGLGYDSNIFADKSDKVNDSIYNIKPSFSFKSDLDGPINLKGSYLLNWVKYSDVDSENYTGQIVDFGLNSKKGFYTFDLTGIWNKDRKIVSSQINEYDLTNNYKVIGTFNRDSSFSVIAVDVIYEVTRFDREEFKVSDSDSIGGNASYLQTFNKLAAGIEISFKNETFEVGIKDNQQYSVGLVFKYNYSKKTSAELKLGYKTIEFKDKNTDREDGLDASLLINFNQTAYLSYKLSSSYSVQTGFEGQAEKYFTNVLSVSFDDKSKYEINGGVKREDTNYATTSDSRLMAYFIEFTFKGVPYCNFTLNTTYDDKSDVSGGYDKLLISFLVEGYW